jgi:hypothetical protein
MLKKDDFHWIPGPYPLETWQKNNKGISPATKSPQETRKPWGLLHAVSLPEPLHAAGRIDQLLLAGEKRMTGGAYFGGNLRLGGTRLKSVAAEAFYRNFQILGVNTFFHIFLLARGFCPGCT